MTPPDDMPITQDAARSHAVFPAGSNGEFNIPPELTIVVDPYLIDVIPSEGAWAPLSYRERVRAMGPTNKPDHGKQAEGGAAIDAIANASGAARSTGRVNLIKRK